MFLSGPSAGLHSSVDVFNVTRFEDKVADTESWVTKKGRGGAHGRTSLTAERMRLVITATAAVSLVTESAESDVCVGLGEMSGVVRTPRPLMRVMSWVGKRRQGTCEARPGLGLTEDCCVGWIDESEVSKVLG